MLLSTTAAASSPDARSPGTQQSPTGHSAHIIASERLETDVLLEGTVTLPTGKAAAGVSIEVAALPPYDQAVHLKDGERFDLVPVSVATADPSGRFLARVDPTIDLAAFASEEGRAEFVAIASGEGHAGVSQFERAVRSDGALTTTGDPDGRGAEAPMFEAEPTSDTGTVRAESDGGGAHVVDRDGVPTVRFEIVPLASGSDSSAALEPGSGACRVQDTDYHTPGTMAIVAHNEKRSFRTNFVHTRGQNSSMGNGINLHYDDIGWYQSSTVTRERTVTEGYPARTRKGWIAFRSHFIYQFAVCNHPRGNWSQVRNMGHQGGAWAAGGSSTPWAPGKPLCGKYQRGSFVRVNRGHATTWTNGVKTPFLSLSSKTGYTTRASIKMAVTSRGSRWICGKNASPARDTTHVGFLVGRNPRGW